MATLQFIRLPPRVPLDGRPCGQWGQPVAAPAPCAPLQEAWRDAPEPWLNDGDDDEAGVSAATESCRPFDISWADLWGALRAMGYDPALAGAERYEPERYGVDLQSVREAVLDGGLFLGTEELPHRIWACAIPDQVSPALLEELGDLEDVVVDPEMSSRELRFRSRRVDVASALLAMPRTEALIGSIVHTLVGPLMGPTQRPSAPLSALQRAALGDFSVAVTESVEAVGRVAARRFRTEGDAFRPVENLARLSKSALNDRLTLIGFVLGESAPDVGNDFFPRNTTAELARQCQVFGLTTGTLDDPEPPVTAGLFNRMALNGTALDFERSAVPVLASTPLVTPSTTPWGLAVASDPLASMVRDPRGLLGSVLGLVAPDLPGRGPDPDTPFASPWLWRSASLLSLGHPRLSKMADESARFGPFREGFPLGALPTPLVPEAVLDLLQEFGNLLQDLANGIDERAIDRLEAIAPWATGGGIVGGLLLIPSVLSGGGVLLAAIVGSLVAVGIGLGVGRRALRRVRDVFALAAEEIREAIASYRQPRTLVQGDANRGDPGILLRGLLVALREMVEALEDLGLIDTVEALQPLGLPPEPTVDMGVARVTPRHRSLSQLTEACRSGPALGRVLGDDDVRWGPVLRIPPKHWARSFPMLTARVAGNTATLMPDLVRTAELTAFLWRQQCAVENAVFAAGPLLTAEGTAGVELRRDLAAFDLSDFELVDGGAPLFEMALLAPQVFDGRDPVQVMACLLRLALVDDAIGHLTGQGYEEPPRPSGDFGEFPEADASACLYDAVCFADGPRKRRLLQLVLGPVEERLVAGTTDPKTLEARRGLPVLRAAVEDGDRQLARVFVRTALAPSPQAPQAPQGSLLGDLAAACLAATREDQPFALVDLWNAWACTLDETVSREPATLRERWVEFLEVVCEPC